MTWKMGKSDRKYVQRGMPVFARPAGVLTRELGATAYTHCTLDIRGCAGSMGKGVLGR